MGMLIIRHSARFFKQEVEFVASLVALQLKFVEVFAVLGYYVL
jgi:hypothetical protein